MVDRDLLLRKLADLELYVRQVSGFSHITIDQYRADWKTQRIVERTLQMAIETAVDVANHVIADRRLRVPSTYAEVFEILGDAGLLEAPLAASLVAMARFRNVLVHGYAHVDPAVVVRILDGKLDDLRRFQQVATRWLEPESPTGNA